MENDNLPRRNRWLLAILLFALTTINFADRGVLGVAAPAIRKDFHLSVSDFGVVASAFGWGYTIFVFLSGPVVARLGARRTLQYFVSAWSVFIACIGLIASGFYSLIVLRILFGASEGAVFPASSQLLGKSYSHEEMARAAAIMATGLPLGSLLIVPIAVWLTGLFGWQSTFVLLGVVGGFWVVVATKIIPRQSATYSTPEPANHWRVLLRNKTILLIGLGFFSSAYVLYFMLNFFPSYLVDQRKISYSAVALIGVLPWITMALGAISSGFVSDFLYKKTQSLKISRSYFSGLSLIVTGVLIFVSTRTENTSVIISLLSAASFTNFWANSIFFAMTIDAAPRLAGPASAVTNGIGSLAGILSPLLTGYLVQISGSYGSAFVLATAVVVVSGVAISLFCNFEISE